MRFDEIKKKLMKGDHDGVAEYVSEHLPYPHLLTYVSHSAQQDTTGKPILVMCEVLCHLYTQELIAIKDETPEVQEAILTPKCITKMMIKILTTAREELKQTMAREFK